MRRYTRVMFNNRYESMTKSRVIEQYQADYREFLELANMAIGDRDNRRYVGNWGINEILGHIAGWNPETIAAIKAVTDGKLPWFFDHEKQIDDFNQRQVQQRENVPIPMILEEIEINHQKLIDFLKYFPDGLFHQSFGIIWHQRPLTPALVCSYRHYATHTRDILTGLEARSNKI